MDSSAPVETDLHAIYTLGVDAQTERYARLVRAFEAAYGAPPDFIARAPGRVNIIGEHIDYCGLPVFPMAIAPDTLIAARPNGTEAIHLANSNAEKYPAREFLAGSTALAIDSSVHDWANYFQCAYRGLFEHLGRKGSKGFDVLLDGTVPAGSGLSSSAAFVCATLLAVQRINGVDISKIELASIAARAERYVGVNAGGMDQTTSIMAQQGSALFIEFDPRLEIAPVKLPDTSPPIAFVIANTLVVSDKAVTAPVCYNLRVVETRIGALILAKHLGVADRAACRDVDPLTFKAVMDEYFGPQDADSRDGVQVWVDRLGAMLDESARAFGGHPDGYTREQMAAALDVSPAALSARVHEDRFPVRAERFKLLQRAQHAFSEALRVVRFRQICESGDPQTDYFAALGELMNESQDSCRDLFECSCAELDELCAIAREAGSFGSRLTGAGWGGCSVHLVRQDRIDSVKQALAEKYYAKRFPALTAAELDGALFASAPGRGACYVTRVLDL